MSIPSNARAPRSKDPPQSAEPRYVKIWRGLRDPLAFLTGLEAKFGDIVAMRQGVSYVVFHPDYIKHVLQDNHPNYEKGKRYRGALAPLMGNGLFTSEGAFWLRQRRLAQGAFQRARVASFDQPMLECMSELLERWSRKARHDEPVSLREELTDVTLRITLRLIFSANADDRMAALTEAVQGVNQDLKFGAQFLPFHLPGWVPTPKHLRFSRSIRVIDDFVYQAIASRRAAGHPGDDLVGLLLQARDEKTGEGMSDLQLRDELVTFLNAGHDTVTDAVLWAMVLLAKHPEAKQQAQDEITRFAGSGRLTNELTQKMPYLGRVFHESLRLYPPAWAFARTAIHEDSIGGYRIPAQALVAMSPYVTHRSPRFWDRPEAFDPDRFLPERSVSRPKFAYFPFGAGPRICIGAGVAMMEAPLILASILQRFDFDLLNTDEVKPAPRISLRPDSTIRLRLRARQAAFALDEADPFTHNL
jgi:cytochrome P450